MHGLTGSLALREPLRDDGRSRSPPTRTPPRCVAYVLRALDAARAAEHLGAMVLPTNWFSLSNPEQLFVLADLERTARGLPPYLGLNSHLTAEAQLAASDDTDPSLATGFAVGPTQERRRRAWAATWASGFTTLGADFLWMYADGWGGCPRARPTPRARRRAPRGAGRTATSCSACDPRFNAGVGLDCTDCEMGAGFSVRRRHRRPTSTSSSCPAHGAPAMTFTWARDVVPFLFPTALYRQRVAARRSVAARRAAVHAAWPQWIPQGAATTPCLAPRLESPHRDDELPGQDLQADRHVAVPRIREER